MINESTFTFIMSKLFDIKQHCEAPDVSEIKNACEKFIKASYHFIVRNYAENLTDQSLKIFLLESNAILSKLETEYKKALISNHRHSQIQELQQKTQSIDISLLVTQRCKDYQKVVETLLYSNYRAKSQTQPEPKAK